MSPYGSATTPFQISLAALTLIVDNSACACGAQRRRARFARRRRFEMFRAQKVILQNELPRFAQTAAARWKLRD